MYIKVIQLYVYIYPLFFRFPSHLGHRRACLLIHSGVRCQCYPEENILYEVQLIVQDASDVEYRFLLKIVFQTIQWLLLYSELGIRHNYLISL